MGTTQLQRRPSLLHCSIDLNPWARVISPYWNGRDVPLATTQNIQSRPKLASFSYGKRKTKWEEQMVL